MAVADIDVKTNYLARFKSAQRVQINWDDVLGNDLFKFVTTHTENFGCSRELLAWPLLSATSSCMGPQTTVQVNNYWTEKVVLWFVVAARRGEKKTTVLARVKRDNIALEQEIQALHSNNDQKSTSRVVIDERNLPEVSRYLQTAKTKNEVPNLMFLIDDIGSVVRNTSDHRKAWDFTAIKHSYNGPDSTGGNMRLLQDDCQDENINIEPFVNFVATVQALDLPAMLDQDDPDGLVDRALLLCAQDARDVHFGTPSLYNPPSIQTVLSAIRNLHQVQKVTYTFSPDGETQLGRCFEALQKMKDAFSHNESCHGAINFAFGHLIRLCGVISALRNGLAMANRGSFLPARVIDQDTVKNVYGLVRCLLLQKFALMTSVLKSPDDDVISQGSVDNEGSVDARMGKVTTSGASENVEEDVIEITMNGDQVVRINPENKTEVPNSPSSSSLQIVDIRSDLRSGFDQMNQSDVMILRDGYTESYVAPPKAEEQVPAQPVFPNQMGDTKPFVGGLEFTSDTSITPTTSISFTTPVSPNDASLPSTSFDGLEQKPHQNAGGRVINVNPQVSHSRRGPRPQHMFVNRAEARANKFSIKHHVNRFNYKSARKFERPSTHGNNSLNANSLFKMNDTDFLFQCGSKIRKLLLTTGSIVTASYACQYRLFPPIPVEQRVSSPRTTHPAWAAAKFFEKLQSLGFGTLLVFRGQSVKFEKKRYENMSATTKEYMKKIRLSQEDYTRSLPSNTSEETSAAGYDYQFHNIDFNKESGAH